MTTIYLYIKTHHVKTSKGIILKYFGRTTQDPFKYAGSGTYWMRHLNKYGNGMDTVIYGTYYLEKEKDLLKETALRFSVDNNIVNSKEWANLEVENGLDGGLPVGLMSDKARSNVSAAKMGKPAHNKGKTHTPEARAKMSASKKGKPPPNKGKTLSAETRANISAGSKKRLKIECPHCERAFYMCHYAPWHGDKCKQKP